MTSELLGGFLGGRFLSVVSFFSLLLSFVSSKSFLIVSWSLFGTNLSSEGDLRNLENIKFSLDIQQLLNNRDFRSEDGLDHVLVLCWSPVGCSSVFLGNTFGPPDRPERADTLWPLRSLGSLGSLFGLFFLLWCPSSRF